MTLFQNLREGLGGYFSQSASNPAKRTTRSSSLEEVKSRLDRDTVSPSKRTSEWLKAHSVEVRTPKALAVKGGKVTKPTPSKKQSAKAKGKFWARVLPKFLDKSTNEETQDLLEGTTVFGDDQIDTVYDDDNEATLLGPVASPNAQLAVPAPNAAEDEDTLYTPTAEDLEVMKKWSNDQVWLFHRLNRRGFEPLLPSTWDFEFVTLPPPVFSDDDSEVLIKARGGNEYNGELYRLRPHSGSRSKLNLTSLSLPGPAIPLHARRPRPRPHLLQAPASRSHPP